MKLSGWFCSTELPDDVLPVRNEMFLILYPEKYLLKNEKSNMVYRS